jgi:hypothetical protein
MKKRMSFSVGGADRSAPPASVSIVRIIEGWIILAVGLIGASIIAGSVFAAVRPWFGAVALALSSR